MREIFIGENDEKYVTNDKMYIGGDELLEINDKMATSIMRKGCIISVDTEIHGMKKHHAYDLTLPLTEEQLTLIAMGKVKPIKSKSNYIDCVCATDNEISVSINTSQSERARVLKIDLKTTQKLIQTAALHHIVEMAAGLGYSVFRLYTDRGKDVFIKLVVTEHKRYKLNEISPGKMVSVDKTIDRWNYMLAKGMCLVDVDTDTYNEYYIDIGKDNVMRITREAERRAMNIQ